MGQGERRKGNTKGRGASKTQEEGKRTQENTPLRLGKETRPEEETTGEGKRRAGHGARGKGEFDVDMYICI